MQYLNDIILSIGVGFIIFKFFYERYQDQNIKPDEEFFHPLAIRLDRLVENQHRFFIVDREGRDKLISRIDRIIHNTSIENASFNYNIFACPRCHELVTDLSDFKQQVGFYLPSGKYKLFRFTCAKCAETSNPAPDPIKCKDIYV